MYTIDVHIPMQINFCVYFQYVKRKKRCPVLLESVRIISERVDEEEGVHEVKEYF
jgi:hypothetical protein